MVLFIWSVVSSVALLEMFVPMIFFLDTGKNFSPPARRRNVPVHRNTRASRAVRRVLPQTRRRSLLRGSDSATELDIYSLVGARHRGAHGGTRRAPLRTASHRFEVACALSHREALRRFVQSGESVCFVFEDDNVIGERVSRFHEIRRWGAKNGDDFHVINVSPCNSLVLPGRVGLQRGNQGYERAHGEPQGAGIRSFTPVRMPIDDWLHSLPSECLHPRVFEQEDASAPLTMFTLVPFVRKLEYAMSAHVVLLSVACASIIFYE